MKTKLLRTLLICSTIAGAYPVVAQAADGGVEGTFQMRLRGIGVFADGDGVVAQNGLQTDVGDAITPEVDFTYFFTDNIAAELIAATSQHTITAGTLDVGDAYILPPTLTVQYHFQPTETFSPYVGVGLNYSIFYSEDSGLAFNDLEVDGGFGYAAQAGFDLWLNDSWGLNFDVKYINLEVDVDVDLTGTPDTALDAHGVDLNPVIVGAGLSYRF